MVDCASHALCFCFRSATVHFNHDAISDLMSHADDDEDLEHENKYMTFSTSLCLYTISVNA